MRVARNNPNSNDFKSLNRYVDKSIMIWNNLYFLDVIYYHCQISQILFSSEKKKEEEKRMKGKEEKK